jgi:hypothetical protein
MAVMQGTALYVGALSGIFGLSALAGVGVLDVYQTTTSPPPKPEPRVLRLESLEVKGGKIHQKIIVSGDSIIQATWNAQIQRGGVVGSICGGRS